MINAEDLIRSARLCTRVISGGCSECKLQPDEDDEYTECITELLLLLADEVEKLNARINNGL